MKHEPLGGPAESLAPNPAAHAGAPCAWDICAVGARDDEMITVPRAVRLPVELVPPDGFDPGRVETWAAPTPADVGAWSGGALAARLCRT